MDSQTTPVSAPAQPATDAERISQLEQRLAALENRTNLISPKFWTRAWAVAGHGLSIYVFITAAIWLVMLILMFMLGGFAAILGS